MDNTSKIQYHRDICQKIHDLYEAKNNDYGDSVNDTFNKFGIDAFLVRMYDKLNRVYSLTRKDKEIKIQDEKIEDTLLDLANYAIITLVELKNVSTEENTKAPKIEPLLEIEEQIKRDLENCYE